MGMEGGDKEEEQDSSEDDKFIENVKEHSQEHEEQDLEGDSREDVEEDVEQYAEDDEGDVGMDAKQEVAIPLSLLHCCISKSHHPPDSVLIRVPQYLTPIPIHLSPRLENQVGLLKKVIKISLFTVLLIPFQVLTRVKTIQISSLLLGRASNVSFLQALC